MLDCVHHYQGLKTAFSGLLLLKSHRITLSNLAQIIASATALASKCDAMNLIWCKLHVVVTHVNLDYSRVPLEVPGPGPDPGRMPECGCSDQSLKSAKAYASVITSKSGDPLFPSPIQIGHFLSCTCHQGMTQPPQPC